MIGQYGEKMIYEYPAYKPPTNNTRNVLAGMVFGGLVGALTMLLLAPRSGKDTKRQIQEKGIEVRDWTTEKVEDTIAQVRTKANEIAMGAKDHVQELAVEQLENVSEAAQAEEKVIQGS
jgi:gas vesicle protein